MPHSCLFDKTHHGQAIRRLRRRKWRSRGLLRGYSATNSCSRLVLALCLQEGLQICGRSCAAIGGLRLSAACLPAGAHRRRRHCKQGRRNQDNAQAVKSQYPRRWSTWAAPLMRQRLALASVRWCRNPDARAQDMAGNCEMKALRRLHRNVDAATRREQVLATRAGRACRTHLSASAARRDSPALTGRRRAEARQT